MFKIIVILFGICLEVFGKLIGQTHFQWLGHYLAGSGKEMPFPEKHKEYIKNIFEIFGSISENWEYYDLGTEDRDLPLTLGKFKVKREKNILFIEDYYVFYKWCGHPQHDYFSCNCQNKEEDWFTFKSFWHHLPFLSITNKIYSKLQVLRHKLMSRDKCRNLQNSLAKIMCKILKLQEGRILKSYKGKIDFFLSLDGIHITFRDGIFENVGKPFYTRGQVELNLDDKDKIDLKDLLYIPGGQS